jgi:hypothetical protein
MQAMAIVALCASLAACGTGASVTPQQDTSTAQVPAGTKAKKHEQTSPSGHKAPSWSTSVIAFELASSKGRCHGLFVSKDAFLAPHHCFPAGEKEQIIAITAGDKTVSARIVVVIPAPSEEVEGMMLIRLREGQTSNPADPHAFILPEIVYPPFPLTMEPTVGNPVVCSTRRYNHGGLVAYECPTLPAMSGLVLRSKDSKPFAIHIGRKGGLGYGLVLGRIQNETLDALKSASAGGPP